MDVTVLASGSSGNAYIVGDGTTSLLLDAGIPLRRIAEGCGFAMHELGACLLTHEHKDHSASAQKLAMRSVDVYASPGTIRACGLSGHRIHPVRAFDAFDVGSFRILPFDVVHDAAEPLGFFCTSVKTKERLLYVTDTRYIRYRFDGLTHILIECNHDVEGVRESVKQGALHLELGKRIIRNHLSLERLVEILRVNDTSRLRQIYLLHMSDDNADAEKMIHEVRCATGAEVYVGERNKPQCFRTSSPAP